MLKSGSGHPEAPDQVHHALASRAIFLFHSIESQNVIGPAKEAIDSLRRFLKYN